MKKQKSSALCLGYTRLSAIDTGHDLRLHRTSVTLPDDDDAKTAHANEGPLDSTGIGYDDRDGHRYIAWGTQSELIKELKKQGYVIAGAAQ